MCVCAHSYKNMKTVKLGFTTTIWAYARVCWCSLRFIAHYVWICVSLIACHFCARSPACVRTVPCECEHMCFLVPLVHVYVCQQECKKKQCHKESCPHSGLIHARVGPAQQIDKNEIFRNLNVNGNEIYRWVLCNYQCHNLLDLCLCKVQSKSARDRGGWEATESVGMEGKIKRTNEGVWRGYQDDRARERMIYI